MTQRTWSDLRRDQKVRIINRGRALGWTDERIAAKYGVRKGAVVGFRHRYIPELTGKTRGFGMPGKSDVTVPPPDQGKPAAKPAEPGVCEWPLFEKRSGRLAPCNQPTAPGEKLCELHKAGARGKVRVDEM